MQLLGAMALLSGKVAEMATGEGKTLTAAIAAYGHVRLGNGPVHVLTVNDYLARRDAEWMEPVYTLLGLTVGWVTEASTPEERREAYACDVTYVSVSEAGFDYLRDQLVTDIADRVQPPLATAIVDEADSILIDEARVPMVLAGAVAGEQDPVHAGRRAGARPAQGQALQVAEDGRSVAFTAAGPGRRRGQAGRHRPVRRRARRRSSPRSTWRCTRTPCCTATSTTSSATARSS